MPIGSYNIDDKDAPVWTDFTKSICEYEYRDEQDAYQFTVRRGKNPDGSKVIMPGRGNDLGFDERFEPDQKKFEWQWGIGARWAGDEPAKKVLYRLPELIESTGTVFVVEGEKDVETLRGLGLTATCNPFGALKWMDEFSPWLEGRDVVILQDNDDRGERHALKVQTSVRKFAASVKRILLPGLPEKGDVTDWLGIDGNTPEKLADIVAKAPFAKPVIHIRKGELSRYVDEAEEALLSEDIYQRAGELVRPYAQTKVIKGEHVSYVCFAEITDQWITDRLSKRCTFLEYAKREKKSVAKNPPREIATTIRARIGEWKFPAISGVINCPTIRRDGSILSEPGFDPATGLYLFDPLKLPPIPDKPSRDECLAALGLLDELLSEVPFVTRQDETREDNAARSAALSLLMTPVLRPALDVAPFHLITAPQPGSGKSFIVDLASQIFNGDDQAPLSAGDKVEETEKRLVAAVLEGQQLISLDNVNGDLAGDFLCQLIERPHVKPRILGRSEAPSIANTFTTVATGNNAAAINDMVRRTLTCAIDANVEDTTKRTFKLDPKGMIRKNRPAYVAAILTIAKGHIASDEKPLPPIPSFGDWSNMVRSALVWLGRRDPWDTASDAIASDPQKLALKALAEYWPKTGFLTAGELIKAANETVANDNARRTYPELLECLETILSLGNRPRFDATELGYALRPFIDRTVGNKKFVKDKKRGFWFEPIPMQTGTDDKAF